MEEQINMTVWKFHRGQQTCQMSEANKPPRSLRTLLMGTVNFLKETTEKTAPSPQIYFTVQIGILLSNIDWH